MLAKLNYSPCSPIPSNRRDEPRLRQLIKALEGPYAEEPYPVDVDRTIRFLNDPQGLKALAELRLGHFWHDYFAPRWHEALPVARGLAADVGRRFVLGDPRRVLESVVGRNATDRMAPFDGRRFVFCPIPFLGPYVTASVIPYPSAPEQSASDVSFATEKVYVGFGLVRSDVVSDEVHDDGSLRDLLAALQALADEARLNAVAYIRRHGCACAADLMDEFGWSQPAASRHLRALDSTGLLSVEWVDGVKWYAIAPERGQQVVQSLERFLFDT